MTIPTYNDVLQMNKNTIAQNILTACAKLYNHDKKLFDLGHYEETINHRLAVHLIPLFSRYDVDVEYSLMGQELKKNENGNRVRPDIVIHKRGNNETNLAIIEIKRASNSRSDENKIKAYSNLNYRFGVAIRFKNDGGINLEESKIYSFGSQEWTLLDECR